MRSARVWHTAGHAAQATHSPGRILNRHETEAVFKREASTLPRGPDRPGGTPVRWKRPVYHNIRLAFQTSPGVVRTAVRKRSA